MVQNEKYNNNMNIKSSHTVVHQKIWMLSGYKDVYLFLLNAQKQCLDWLADSEIISEDVIPQFL